MRIKHVWQELILLRQSQIWMWMWVCLLMNHLQDCRSCTKKVNRVIFMFSVMLMLLYTHFLVLPSFHQEDSAGFVKYFRLVWDAELSTIFNSTTSDTKQLFNVKYKTFMNNLLYWLILCLTLKCLRQWKLYFNTQNKLKAKWKLNRSNLFKGHSCLSFQSSKDQRSMQIL